MTTINEPARLREAWAELRSRDPHLHGPEAAARLGVPEAALLASRIGHGALAVRLDLHAMLAPCGGWGKVLVAGRNRLGVALLVMDDPQFRPEADRVKLSTEQHGATLATAGIARCYLFEERDHHGHTFSLNWFDGRGDVIGRVFLLSKSGRERAIPHLQSCALDEQDPRWQPDETRAPVMVSEGAAAPARTLAAGDAAIGVAEAAVLGCESAGPMIVVMQGPGIVVRYDGPLGKSMRTPGAVHASDAGCKLHLRMSAVAKLALGADGAGRPMVWIHDADGGALALAPRATPGPGREWLDAILHRVPAVPS